MTSLSGNSRGYCRRPHDALPTTDHLLATYSTLSSDYAMIPTQQTGAPPPSSALQTDVLQRAIFNNAHFSYIATDAAGLIQIFNIGAERMLGYGSHEVVGAVTPDQLVDPLEIVARAQALRQTSRIDCSPHLPTLLAKAAQGVEDIVELTFLCKNGDRLAASVSVSALRDGAEAIIGYLLIGTDNTQRKLAEAEQAVLDQRLRDQQFYTRSLIESNIDALMTCDLEGVISDVNHQMSLLTGCSREQLIGTPFKTYFIDPELAEAAIRQVLREGAVIDFELVAISRDGVPTPVSYNATTYHDSENRLQGVFAAARNIAERKQLENVLQEKNVELELSRAAAEKANQAKSEFLSNMSHELRTPLNAVLGFAQLMESATPQPSPAQKLSIEQILKGGWYLLRLINEILDLAMIESGKLAMALEPMSLTEVLKDCQVMIAPQAASRHIAITFALDDLPHIVYADRTRIKQVMINLLSNAIKYNRDHGQASVRCEAAPGGRLRVSVTDTGVGLSASQIKQLFQPFNRLGQESASTEGTGIGLVVTKQLVELMGGTIGVDSTVDVGSTFWFELITTTDALQSWNEALVMPVAELSGAPHAALRTLLYVEDNQANVNLVEQLIERRSDLTLLVALNGEAGVGMAREHRPDVILMDINLPGMSGLDALKILRADQTTARIPVLALSANAIQQDIEQGLSAGFFRYLTKPIKIDEFMSTLDIALDFAASQVVKPMENDL
ncbi:PAS domain S-box protein [Duganella sp. BuS-21]|uniref:hybrid sensor histidine kinase/response regulator n=1 Tax=Duganella sp. BuS-21 TaxID=2943848 RepID=UPI0035A6D788